MHFDYAGSLRQSRRTFGTFGTRLFSGFLRDMFQGHTHIQHPYSGTILHGQIPAVLVMARQRLIAAGYDPILLHRLQTAPDRRFTGMSLLSQNLNRRPCAPTIPAAPIGQGDEHQTRSRGRGWSFSERPRRCFPAHWDSPPAMLGWACMQRRRFSALSKTHMFFSELGIEWIMRNGVGASAPTMCSSIVAPFCDASWQSPSQKRYQEAVSKRRISDVPDPVSVAFIFVSPPSDVSHSRQSVQGRMRALD